MIRKRFDAGNVYYVDQQGRRVELKRITSRFTSRIPEYAFSCIGLIHNTSANLKSK